jgi:hypothetical protein
MPDLNMYVNKQLNGRYKSTGKRASEVKYKNKKILSDSMAINPKMHSPSLRMKPNLNLAQDHS